MDEQELFFKTQTDWQAWLGAHYAQQKGVWLRFAKKDSGITSITYDEALDVALCYGWIDGQAKAVDGNFYQQKFTPRRAKSMWSKRNVGKVAVLTKAGKMQPSGLAQVVAAKKDGRWVQAYDSPKNSEVPADFKTALDENPKAKAFFETLNKTNRFTILWRIQTAKKPETRTKRIEQLIAMLASGQAPH